MAVDGSIKIGTEIDQSGLEDGLKKVKNLLDDAAKYYATLGKEGSDAFKKISDQLKNVDAAAAISGDKIGALASKKKILQTAIESLIANGLKPEDLQVKSLQKAYDELSAIQAKNESGTGKLKKTAKETFADMRDFMQGPVAAAKMVYSGIKKVGDAVNALTDAYKVQAKAETQLESAAKNNPYLDSASVQALKDYAGELQGISTVGDEELIPMMAQLAAAGRTQDEIMQIMSTALDISATGTMSLDSAMRQLNKSYGGFAGELGESIPEIKALSSEELKQGGAVKILSERYKGMAAEVAKTTGTAEQLSNAMGDLNEELGAPFEKALAPVRTFFKELVGGWAAALKVKREYEGAQGDTSSTAAIDKQIAGEQQILDKLLDKRAYYAEYFGTVDAGVEKQVAKQEKLIADLEIERATRASIEAITATTSRRESAAASTSAAAAKREKDAADYIKANTKAREDAVAALELQAKTEGRNVENSELLAIYQKSYVDLVSQSNGLVSERNQAAKDLLASTLGLLEAEKGITDEKEAQEKADEQLTELQAALGEIQRELTDSDALRQQMAALNEYYYSIITNERITAEEKEKIAKEYAEKKAILEEQITATEKAAQQERIASYFEAVNTFATQYASIMSSISDLASQMIEDQATIKTSELEDHYAAGEISAEEYEKKLTEIEKEAAEKKYKIAMWEWSSQILTAVANTAQGATKALAQGGYLGLITAALVTAAGGAQLATIIANKPIKPTFAMGGIVPGTSYTGDRVEALVNSGEMILNAAQQKRLFDSLNGGSSSVGSRIQVYNSAANDVRVEPQITEDGVRLMIRKTVAKDTADGRFHQASRIAQTTQRGTRYTN